MSGTSLDGVDGVLADFSTFPPQQLASGFEPFDQALRHTLLQLNSPGPDELATAALAANVLAQRYAACVARTLAQARIAASAVRAIGCHGQTVRHRPELGFTLQLNNPALLAELTGIAVVADFRSRDLAAGGQGAPLVPAFHDALFRHATRHRVIVNIGGIANLTDLPPGGPTSGFDTGPGNLLMDGWISRHQGLPFDRDGAWAVSGQVIPALLSGLLAEPYFQQPPPKSSGRDLFNLAWLERLLQADYRAQDVQASLLALTAETIAAAITSRSQGAQEVYLCGGGAYNNALRNALRQALPGIKLDMTDALGIGAKDVEALAFAWLAQQTVLSRPGNLPTVTGARGPRVLGAIYPR